MKILDDIKAKREVATPGPWEKDFCPMEDAMYLMAQVGNGKVIAKCMSHTNDIDYIARMDPRTCEAMENVIRAAKKFTDPETHILQVTAMTAYADLEEALEALERIWGRT